MLIASKCFLQPISELMKYQLQVCAGLAFVAAEFLQ